ncbi:MAG: hypothetical protein NT003_02890 [Candidatus Magasanikbacteria bacterium]|nr:hypothetical protein [Candidatus Magasanikbacteria bacterium]
MSLGPKFSSTAFQKVMQRAIGGRPSDVKNILTRVGGKDILKNGASVADTKELIKKMEASGDIEDSRAAGIAFRKAERVANAIDRIHHQQNREERLKEFDRTRSNYSESVVREQLHGVAAINDKNSSAHSVSISQLNKNTSVGQNGKSDSRLAGSGGSKSRLIDIPLY